MLIELKANEARAKSNYEKQLWLYTGKISEIGDYYISLNGMKTYIGTDDIIKLNEGEEVTVCGYVSIVSQYFGASGIVFDKAFLVE